MVSRRRGDVKKAQIPFGVLLPDQVYNLLPSSLEILGPDFNELL